MSKKFLYTLWGALFILCAGLGFIPAPAGFLKFLMVALSLAFFAVPACLVKQLEKEKNRMHLTVIRNLALTSLVLTVALIMANFFSLMAPEGLGNALYVLLVIVSAPMVCSQYWVLSLFGWACLMLWTRSLLKKK